MLQRGRLQSMLESYLMDYNSIQSKLNLLKSQLHGAEVLVNLLNKFFLCSSYLEVTSKVVIKLIKIY